MSRTTRAVANLDARVTSLECHDRIAEELRERTDLGLRVAALEPTVERLGHTVDLLVQLMNQGTLGFAPGPALKNAQAREEAPDADAEKPATVNP